MPPAAGAVQANAAQANAAQANAALQYDKNIAPRAAGAADTGTRAHVLRTSTRDIQLGAFRWRVSSVPWGLPPGYPASWWGLIGRGWGPIG